MLIELVVAATAKQFTFIFGRTQGLSLGMDSCIFFFPPTKFGTKMLFAYFNFLIQKALKMTKATYFIADKWEDLDR